MRDLRPVNLYRVYENNVAGLCPNRPRGTCAYVVLLVFKNLSDSCSQNNCINKESAARLNLIGGKREGYCMTLPIVYIVQIAALCSCVCLADYGCMEKSYHLSQLNDPKVYYHVKGPDGGPCPCPCDKYIVAHEGRQRRHICLKCHHLRIPRPSIMVRYDPTKKYQVCENFARKGSIASLFSDIASIPCSIKKSAISG